MTASAPDSAQLLDALDRVIASRKEVAPEASYVASLFHRGVRKICAKVEEEAHETVDAALEQGTDHLVYEVADLWFHSLVLLHHRGRTSHDVLIELARRFGVSGHDEKASRGQGESPAEDAK